MNNSEPPDRRQKQKLNNSKSLKKTMYVIVALLIFGSAILFGIIWKEDAYSISAETTTQKQYLGKGIFQFNHTTTYKIANYFPFHPNIYEAKIYLRTISDENGTISLGVKEITNDPIDLVKNEIAITSHEIKYEYGEEEIKPSDKRNRPTTFPSVRTPGIAITTVTVEWTNNGTTEASLRYRLHGTPIIKLTIFPSTFSSFLEYLLLGAIPRLFWNSIPYLFFVLAGFGFSWASFKKKSNLREAYGYLVKFNPKNETKVSGLLLTKLKILHFFPRQIGIVKRVIFGLSILFFEARINNCFKKHKEYSDFLGKETIKKSFARFPEESLTKLSDILPEGQLIAIVLGFLASVGISFSWNIDAIIPFLYSFAIFYFFMNVGSIFYLTGKSKEDRKWIFGLLIVSILIILFPWILEILRIF